MERYFIRFSRACRKLKAVAVSWGMGSFIFRKGVFNLGHFNFNTVFTHVILKEFLKMELLSVYKHNDELPF